MNAIDKEIVRVIIQIHNVMDFIDDGYHNKDIANLIKISNEIFDRLSPELQKELQLWYNKRYAAE